MNLKGETDSSHWPSRAAVLVVFPLLAIAKPAALDKKFGKHGVAVAQVGNDGSGANLVAVAKDGGIIAAGMSVFAQGEDSEGHFVVAKFTSKGKLDSSFGSKGSTMVDFGGGPLAFDVPAGPRAHRRRQDPRRRRRGERGLRLGRRHRPPRRRRGAGRGLCGRREARDERRRPRGRNRDPPSRRRRVLSRSARRRSRSRSRATTPTARSITGFGTGGFTLTDLGASANVGHAVLTDDGKIVVVDPPVEGSEHLPAGSAGGGVRPASASPRTASSTPPSARRVPRSPTARQ